MLKYIVLYIMDKYVQVSFFELYLNELTECCKTIYLNNQTRFILLFKQLLFH